MGSVQCSLFTVSRWACGFSAVFSVDSFTVGVWVQCSVLWSQFQGGRVGSVQCSLLTVLLWACVFSAVFSVDSFTVGVWVQCSVLC